MKVTQEKLPASQIGLEIEITPEKTQKTYEQVIQNLSRTANIPGFRKGKVPRQILLQRLGMVRIKAAALEELIQDGITEAVKQEDIKAIGQPRLRSSFDDLITTYEPGKPLVIEAAVDVPPEVTLTKYTGLELKAEEIKPDPERVNQVLESEREQRSTLIPVSGRAAQIGDTAIIDFQGFLTKAEGEEGEPKPIPGGEATDFQVELQEDKFIPGFISGIIGMNPGETKEVSAQFPDPYVNEELSGKAAHFTVTLKEIKEKELPELNDDFAQEVSEYETLAELRSSLEERYQKEAEQKTRNNKQEALLAELSNYIEAEIPETMVQQEVEAMLTQTAMRLQQQGLDIKKLFTPEIIPQLRERSRGEAVERLKRSLALREIGEKESIKVTEEELQVKVKDLMEQYSQEDVDEATLRNAVEDDLLTEKIVDWLLEHSTIELVPEGTLKPAEEDAEDETSEEEEAVTEEEASSELESAE
jgi:trigger factor